MLVFYKDMARSTSNQTHSPGFFPSLRYLAVSESGEVSAAAPMKEIRYRVKKRWHSPIQLARRTVTEQRKNASRVTVQEQSNTQGRAPVGSPPITMFPEIEEGKKTGVVDPIVVP